jgi:hypothetical protein
VTSRTEKLDDWLRALADATGVTAFLRTRDDVAAIRDQAATAAALATGRAYRCPTCGRISWNLNDVANRYCGVCGFEA